MSRFEIPHDTFVFVGDGFHADVKSRIVAEIDKDLTKHPVGEIERHLIG